MKTKGVLAFDRRGRLLLVAPNLHAMAEKTGMTYSTIASRISDGKASHGFFFDYALEGVVYEDCGKRI